MTSNNAVPKIHHLIDGKPYESKSTEWRDVINPATQEVVARVPFAKIEDQWLAAGASAPVLK